MTTHTEKMGDHWNLRIRAYLESSLNHKKTIKGYLSATLTADESQSIKVEREVKAKTRSDGTAVVDLNMTISEVRSIPTDKHLIKYDNESVAHKQNP